MTMTRPTTEQITHKGQLLSTVLDRPFNLLDYGAVGDGVTDDFDALIACANAVKAAGGGTLYIPFTQNGYYLRRGAFCNLSNTTGISVVSDGATLKLEGGTISQTQSLPVFFAEPAHNITFRGLRFEAASTVVRYQNGGFLGSIQFDVEATLVSPRADINEQCSFRYCISIDGSSTNVTIDNCYFGDTIYTGIQCRKLSGPTNVKNVSFTNLTFNGVNAQCILFGDIDNLLIDNIRCVNKRGDRFDWLLYPQGDLNGVRISNVSMVNASYVPAFGSSGMQLLNGFNGAVVSNIHIENVGSNPCLLGDGSTNCAISNLVIKNCGSNSGPALQIRGLAGFPNRNISIDNLIIDGCPWGILSREGTDLKISNFTIVGATTKALEAGSGDFDMYMSNGTIVDSGQNSQAVRFPNEAGNRKLKMHNVRFEYRSFVPFEVTACLTASNQAATRVELTNCGFVSAFGFASGKQCVAGTTDNLLLNNCWQTGFANLQGSGVSVSSIVPHLPTLQRPLAANSATPSVANAVTFVTANTSATAITNFLDGVPGQDISILVNDANTTFDFSGTNLKGRNGVDYAATSGDVVLAKRIGSNWYCTVVEA